MRIISGLYKGKRINFLKNSITRPLKDVVKENIFNILNHSSLIKIDFKNSSVLDAYSGIGSFGIECLSRGVKKVIFVEKNKEATEILKKNLILLSIKNKASIYNFEIENFLKGEKRKKFNIFFFDPPFSDKTFIQNLDLIKDNEMYEKKHIVIIHRERETEDNLKDYMNVVMSRQYGRSKIFFGFFSK